MRRRKTPRQKYITAEEFSALLSAAARDKTHYMLFFLAGNLGLRVGEVVRLRIEDVDYARKAIRVPTLKQDRPLGREGKIRHGELPKTYADLPLDDDMARLIRGYVGKRRKGWMFPWGESHMPDWKAKKLFRHYCSLAKLDSGYSIHALRHYRGVAAYGALHDIRAVQVLLRHKSLSSSAIYTDMDLEAKRQLSQNVKIVTGVKRNSDENALHTFRTEV